MNSIKEVLEEKGVKQTWLAEQPGKSYNRANGHMQNRHQPKPEVLFEKAEIVAVKPKDNREKIDIEELNSEEAKTLKKSTNYVRI
jgi:hypothetical protein